ncbi:MAG: hypothetical protein H8E26_02445 [FCB group bacterium]|nr:hypothetical protein [FCB group bacterium]
MFLKIPVSLVILLVASISIANGSAFEDHLPETILEDPDKKDAVLQLIDAYGMINPDIIYLYIRQLNNQYGGADSKDTASAIQCTLNKLKIESYSKRNQWVERIRTLTDNHFETNYVHNKLQSQISQKLINMEVKESKDSCDSFDLDLNLQDFFACAYYSPEKEIQFNPDEDYSSLRADLEVKELSQYFDIIVHLESGKRPPSPEVLFSALNYWYLFDSNGNSNLESLQFNIVDLLIEYTRESYIQKHDFQISLGAFPTSSSLDLSYDASIPNMMMDRQRTDAIKRPSIHVGLGFALRFSQWKGPFSGINFDLSSNIPLINQTRKRDGDNTSIFSTGTYSLRKEEYLYEVFQTENIKYFDLTLNVTTPLYLMSNGMQLAGGIILQYEHLSYDFVYDGEYVVYRKYHTSMYYEIDRGLTGSVTQGYSEKDTNIHISLLASYPFTKKLLLDAFVNTIRPSLTLKYVL